MGRGIVNQQISPVLYSNSIVFAFWVFLSDMLDHFVYFLLIKVILEVDCHCQVAQVISSKHELLRSIIDA